MPKRLSGTAASRFFPLLAALLILSISPALHAAPPNAVTAADGGLRVQTMYTTWDDYYFYAAFRVHDTNVLGSNTTTTSQPQQDDDIEVFFETDDARAKVRTPQTYQMAVSAAQGAYFSVGDGTKTPKGKAVYSYKYAVTVNGTLNQTNDTDTGYDVELAIPWSEMGLSGPPKPGAVWGFNVLSRDKDSLNEPSDKFYSLSNKVKAKGDVQNPSKWSHLVFVTGSDGMPSTSDKVVCAKVVGQFPRVNGTIVNGDWPASTQFAFGSEAVLAPAPTVAEEPNTTESPFDNPPPLGPGAPAPNSLPVETGTIDLPGGHGFIKVVPGGIKNPVDMEPPVIVPPGRRENAPIVSAVPPAPNGVFINSGAFVLGQAKPPAYVMGIYRLDFNADARKGQPQNVWNAVGGTLLADQPMNGAGPWFSGLHAQWHRQQLTEMRLAGIEVALLRTRPSDPLLPRELDAFVQALKEMKAAGLDYPLVGVDVTTGQPDLDLIYAHIPAEFRAMQDVPGVGQPGVLVYDLTLGSTAPKALADGTPIARVFYNNGIASVSPGRVDKNAVISRKGGATYDTAWQVALVSTPDQIVVDSWNDFAHGTEIAASRQYGEQYVDATRAQVIGFDGTRQWHAKYLANAVPRTIFPKTLYQIPVRIENAGSLPWRAGEGYSLSTRWYRDGKLYDDSAPRIPLGHDVPPGHALTLSIGLVARDNFGEDLQPGDYTLVIDMVQGQDRWFSYAGDQPLQIPVTVIGADAGVGGTAATFVSTATPAVAQAGTSVLTTVQVRNDGASSWPASYALGYKIQTIDMDGGHPKAVAEGNAPLSPDPVTPGQIAPVSLSVQTVDASGKPLAPGAYRVHWFIKPDVLGSLVNGSYDEMLNIAASLPGAVFALADVPSTMEADKSDIAHIALQNLGSLPLKKASTHLGYHWYYLDGAEREWDGGLMTTLTKDLLPNEIDGAINAPFHAPGQPGRYALVWDVRVGDGPWQSTLPVSTGDDLLQTFITVTGKSNIVPVDLTKLFNGIGIIASESLKEPVKNSGFDGQGSYLPAEQMPPDGTAEIEANPLLTSKPGPPLYPSGYYTSQVGVGIDSNHALSFLYPVVKPGAPNLLVCSGQTVILPGGKYKAIHLLAASSSGASVTATFNAQYDRDIVPLSLTVASWDGLPSDPNSTSAFTTAYRDTAKGCMPIPTTLGDYVLPLDPTKKITALVLPDARELKVLAVTLEKQ